MVDGLLNSGIEKNYRHSEIMPYNSVCRITRLDFIPVSLLPHHLQIL